jgi:uncharacterized protein YjbJ (UPF0337 family)
MKDKAQGKFEELKGKVTQDKPEELKGKGRQTLGDVKNTVRDATGDSEADTKI